MSEGNRRATHAAVHLRWSASRVRKKQYPAVRFWTFDGGINTANQRPDAKIQYCTWVDVVELCRFINFKPAPWRGSGCLVAGIGHNWHWLVLVRAANRTADANTVRKMACTGGTYQSNIRTIPSVGRTMPFSSWVALPGQVHAASTTYLGDVDRGVETGTSFMSMTIKALAPPAAPSTSAERTRQCKASIIWPA